MLFVQTNKEGVGPKALRCPIYIGLISAVTQHLVIDAKSTTKALMWVGGSATQEEGAKGLALIETFKCYPDMYAYMKLNLRQKSLTRIANLSNSEYRELQIRCAEEIINLTKAKMPDWDK